MSLFDLQDVCIAIGSIATLDLPMVVDLIGIYGLKARTLTTTNWFLQALSVIPRGSWGDVARRFTMIRWTGDMMRKAEMMKSLKEREADPEATSRSHHPGGKIIKALTGEGGKLKKPCPKETMIEPAPTTVLGGPTSEPVGTAGKHPEQQPTEVPYVLLDTSMISFVADPSGLVSLDFTRHLSPTRILTWCSEPPTLRLLIPSLVWSDEAANRLTQARDEVVMTRRSMYEVLGRHNDLMKHLEKLRAQKDGENESLLLELEATRAKVHSSKAQVQSLEAQIQRSEEENKGLQAEVEKLRGEVENSWQLGKEKFLQSKEFDTLCSQRALVYFEHGFNGWLARFRANGYSESEHPALFLDVEQALADMPEEYEGFEEGISGPEGAPPHPDVYLLFLVFILRLMKSFLLLLLFILLRALLHMPFQ
ncbi:dynein heavy chain [Dorcoceras hygrometricum]|uniref:Dynein heavy chain n=1 Tax=Dorcoceras hygrometricum TaxID=472368 RepID=A0A2Z7BTF4_9LAMI|nr:dynein heavy chain [Dorcoceras hygrometricum]